MAGPLILVTGATGKVGAAVVDELLRRGARVRTLVHRADARAEALAARGTDVVVGDLLVPGDVRRAMRGTARAFYCPPFHPQAAQAADAFADAAAAERPDHLVSLSQWLASPSHPSPLTRHHWAAERRFDALPGITHTVVAPGFFADNYLRLIGFAAQLGVLPSLTGDSTDAPPSTEDIARVVSVSLCDPDRTAGHRYRPTGPALLSTRGMATILGEVLGHAVRRVEMPLWLFLKAARLQGVPAFELSGFRHYVRDHVQGAFALGAPTDHVTRVTGRPAEDFATIARRYAQRPEARRRPAARLRAWFDFLRTPVMPGVDLDAHDRRLALPAPFPTRYAMEDAEWRLARAGGAA